MPGRLFDVSSSDPFWQPQINFNSSKNMNWMSKPSWGREELQTYQHLGLFSLHAFLQYWKCRSKRKKVGRRRGAELLLDRFRKIKTGQKVIMILRTALTPLRWLLLRKFCLTGDNDHVSNVIYREILLFLLLVIVRIVNPRRYNTFN